MLQIVASLIDAARGIIYDRQMFIVQATDDTLYYLLYQSHILKIGIDGWTDSTLYGVFFFPWEGLF